jgi:GTP-binding protein EngB required for normal cell division
VRDESGELGDLPGFGAHLRQKLAGRRWSSEVVHILRNRVEICRRQKLVLVYDSPYPISLITMD